MHSGAPDRCDPPDPLAGDDPATWQRRIDAVGLPALRVAIRARLGAAVLHRVTEDDVLQETLLHAWRDRDRCEWRGLRAFRRWLLEVVENRIRHFAAEAATAIRGGRDTTLTFSAFAPSSDAGDGSRAGLASRIGLADSGTPSRVASQREEAGAIDAALASLDDDVRDVVRLRLIEELEMEEVAARCGIGVSAAYHRFRQGMASYRLRVRTRLAGHSACASSRAPHDRARE